MCALGKRLVASEVTLPDAEAHVREMQSRLELLRQLLPPPQGEPVLRYARSCIDSTTTQVTDEQLAAFKAVEELRYSVFMPPPV